MRERFKGRAQDRGIQGLIGTRSFVQQKTDGMGTYMKLRGTRRQEQTSQSCAFRSEAQDTSLLERATSRGRERGKGRRQGFG
jgi:hypothetical protein